MAKLEDILVRWRQGRKAKRSVDPSYYLLVDYVPVRADLARTDWELEPLAVESKLLTRDDLWAAYNASFPRGGMAKAEWFDKMCLLLGFQSS